MTESAIIQHIKSGQKEEYRHLVEKYYERIFYTALGFLHCKEDAEEITEDVFIKAYYAIPTFRGDAAFSTWIYRIAVNLCKNQLKKRRLHNAIMDISTLNFLADKSANPQKALENKDESELIEKAISLLPPKQNTAFVLSKYNELSQKEIASIMKISEGAVEQLLVRAKNNLRNYLVKRL
ncbi:RNA polymerase sigma factor [Haoranjiania flava]|uniref:RNA polymerase sigma factor n=1 Tax=Haoranjiania flava TaxID=1856322 RepID=A0AAE3LJU5_9BACT|nr:RNA polymerase sigma factor [Haoranjiania flava]MCU7693734.1 RNA polymerase sigma factor [Haoranjiania flava]